MVSIKTLNSIISALYQFTWSAKNISEITGISLSEVKYSLKVLVSHGYAHKTNFERDYKKSGIIGITYSASESAKEILDSGGFTQQLSMKEKNGKKSKTINKNISINNSTVGDINYDSLFSESPKTNSTNAIPAKNDAKSILYRFYEWVNNNKILCSVLATVIVAILKKQVIFSWLHSILN